MLLALPEPTTALPPPPAMEEAPSLRRRMPAVAAAEPRGAVVPGRVVEEEVDWEEEPRAIIRVLVMEKCCSVWSDYDDEI